MRTYRLILSGLGNVGRSFLEVIQSQSDLLASRYGIALIVTGVADSGGAAIDPSGLDVAALIATKRAGQSVTSLAGVGAPGMSAVELARQAPGDALLESTLTNIRDGQPGLDVIRAALNRGIAVVSANKGPLWWHMLSWPRSPRDPAGLDCALVHVSAATSQASI